MTPVIVRGYLGRECIFEQPCLLDAESAATALIAEEHADQLASGRVDTIEVEFVGFPEYERFFRFGTNVNRITQPIVVRNV